MNSVLFAERQKTSEEYLESVAEEWNGTANGLMESDGVVRGTERFLGHILGDRRFESRIAAASSFGMEAAVPLAIIAEQDPHLPVITIDTGHVFPETWDYLKELKSRLGLTDVRISGLTLDETRRFSPPKSCCAEVKRAAFFRAFAQFPVWISNRKRYHGTSRADLQIVEVKDGKLKINLTAFWSQKQVSAQFKIRNLPYHPLKAFGYGSLLCQPCTKAAAGRRGRPLECGLHTVRQ
jgi:phosphoadenosine phosphosulfate reductase